LVLVSIFYNVSLFRRLDLTTPVHRQGIPETITGDRSEADASAIRRHSKGHGIGNLIRQLEYLNNIINIIEIIEQDHRSVKQVTRPMPGCMPFNATLRTPVGVDLIHRLMLKALTIFAIVDTLVRVVIWPSAMLQHLGTDSVVNFMPIGQEP